MPSLQFGQRSNLLYFASAALLLVSCGCESQAPTATISGTVTVNGKPANGTISFENVDGKGRSDGTAIQDGKFRAEKVLYGEKKVRLTGGYEFVELPVSDLPGAPTNKAVVDIMPPQFNAESTLTITVDKPTVQKDFNLEFEPASTEQAPADATSEASPEPAASGTP